MARDPKGSGPYFKFYSADFHGSPRVQRLSGPARGLYVLLLSRQHQSGPLPTDARKICRTVGWEWADFEDLWEEIREEDLFPETEAGLENPRMALELQEFVVRSKKLSESGKKGNAVRWGSGGDRQAIAYHGSGSGSGDGSLQTELQMQLQTKLPEGYEAAAYVQGRVREVSELWRRVWQEEVDKPWALVDSARAMEAFRQLGGFTDEEIQSRLRWGLKSEDDFIRKQSRDPHTFLGIWNRIEKPEESLEDRLQRIQEEDER